MRKHPPLRVELAFILVAAGAGIAFAREKTAAVTPDRAQVPSWSADDLEFFLHGSIGTEVVPVNVWHAFQASYPDLCPSNLAAFGLIDSPPGGLPIGLSRRAVPHLGGLSSVGINCASCHVAEVVPARDGGAVRVLGATSHFDPEAFFGSVIAATFRTADPANMARFLKSYLVACDPEAPAGVQSALAAELERQGPALAATIEAQLADERAAPPGKLYELDAATLTLDRHYLERSHDLAPVVRAVLQLFHNMRAALHVPHRPPEKAPPRAGPGRNNAFGLLSLVLFGEPTLYGPAKFGLVWDLSERKWVHWDGNTRSPLIRNLAASLGLGAPLDGHRGTLDFALVERQTRLTEQIRAPRYPWMIDQALAERGKRHFEARCATCHVHSPAEEDRRLVALDEVKTDPNRARIIDEHQAQLYNQFFAALEVPGYQPPREPPVRSTQKYVAVNLAGVWARSPYLHNGSVRTMRELLTPAAQRARSFQRGSRQYDEVNMGYAAGGSYLFDTTTDGNSNAGHEYGTTDLTEDEKRALIEYLKTL